MRIAVLMAVAAALTGCVSERTMLTNAAGQATHCDAWGFGIIGAPLAMATHHDCMERAHAAGYSEVGTLQPLPAATATPAVNQAPSPVASTAQP